MVRVYVAGRYNGKDVIEILHNMRVGIDLGVKIMEIGYAPYIPWLDFQIGLRADFDVQTYKDCSMEWVRFSDAVLLVPDQERSSGVLAEIEMARVLNIPVFETIDELKAKSLWGIKGCREMPLGLLPSHNCLYKTDKDTVIDLTDNSVYARVWKPIDPAENMQKM